VKANANFLAKQSNLALGFRHKVELWRTLFLTAVEQASRAELQPQRSQNDVSGHVRWHFPFET